MKINLGFLLGIIIALGLASLFFYAVWVDNFKPINLCLENIAENICYNNGLKFDSVTRDNPPHIVCVANARSFNTTLFKFLPEELKECKKNEQTYNLGYRGN